MLEIIMRLMSMGSASASATAQYVEIRKCGYQVSTLISQIRSSGVWNIRRSKQSELLTIRVPGKSNAELS